MFFTSLLEIHRIYAIISMPHDFDGQSSNGVIGLIALISAFSAFLNVEWGHSVGGAPECKSLIVE